MNKLLPTLLLFITFSCNNTEKESPKESPEIKKESRNLEKELDTLNFGHSKKLSELTATEFLPTLESKFDKNKNSIYAASLLFAWNEIRNTLNSPISKIESKQLQEINNSTTFENVLAKNEYLTQVEITDTSIKSEAYFKKLLPFSVPLTRKNSPIQFNTKAVENFGFYGENYRHDILYYKNDNDFSIQLNPKDRKHQIILVLTDFKKSTIIEEWVNLKQKQTAFRKNHNNHNHWKSDFKDKDFVSIPVIYFNLKTNYKKTEGSTFLSNQQLYIVTKAYQQTAFTLDEKGAKVESHAEMAVDAATEYFGEEQQKPKKLVFDKPFMIFLKRKDSQNPYFAAYISNTELMEGFKMK